VFPELQPAATTGAAARRLMNALRFMRFLRCSWGALAILPIRKRESIEPPGREWGAKPEKALRDLKTVGASIVSPLVCVRRGAR
ncbi:MAG: hypothetical protein JWN96_1797, partial [Mycobacterium sp.]|nr:hypothetical protein [Mycobacterium sp.]